MGRNLKIKRIKYRMEQGEERSLMDLENPLVEFLTGKFAVAVGSSSLDPHHSPPARGQENARWRSVVVPSVGGTVEAALPPMRQPAPKSVRLRWRRLRRDWNSKGGGGCVWCVGNSADRVGKEEEMDRSRLDFVPNGLWIGPRDGPFHWQLKSLTRGPSSNYMTKDIIWTYIL